MEQQYRRLIFYLSFVIATVGIVSFFDKVLSVGIIFTAFLFLGGFLLIDKFRLSGKKIFLVFSIAFIIHLLAVLFIYYADFQPFGDGGGDYDGYNLAAQEVAGRLSNLDFSLGNSLKWGHYYPVIIGYIYALTIPNMLLGQIFNAWVGALIAVLVYLIIIEIKGSGKSAFITSLIVNFYPSFLFYSSLLLKDALVIFLSLSGLFLIVKLLNNFSWKKFIIFYLVSAALFNFRFYMGYALVISFFVSFAIFSSLSIKKKLSYLFIILFLVGFLPQIFANQGYWGTGTIKQYFNKETIVSYREFIYTEKSLVTPNLDTSNLETTPKVTQEYNGFGSSFTVKVNFDKPLLFFTNSLTSFIYSFLGPFPWQIKYKRQISVLLETIPWYFLLFFIMRGVFKKNKKQLKEILPLIIFSFITLVVVSVFIANFGIITRMRIPAFIALLCLADFVFLKDNITRKCLNKIFGKLPRLSIVFSGIARIIKNKKT